LGPKFKQVVKEFWPQAASQMTDFSRGKVNVTPASRGNAVGCSSRADAVIDFFGRVHRSSDSQCFLIGRTNH